MKKGVKTILAGSVLLAASVAIPVAHVVPLVRGTASASDVQFLVPGAGVIEVTAPGRYYLWHDYKTDFRGKYYQGPSTLQGAFTVSVRRENGSVVDYVVDSSTSYSLGNRARKSLGYVDVEEPGTLTFDVAGDLKEAVFSVGRSELSEKLLGLAKGMISAVLCGLVGLVAVIWGAVKFSRGRQQERLLASQTPPPLVP